MDYLDILLDEHEKCTYFASWLKSSNIRTEQVAFDITKSSSPKLDMVKTLAKQFGCGVNFAHAIFNSTVRTYDLNSDRFARWIELSILLDDEVHILDARAFEITLQHRYLIPKLKEAYKRKLPNIDKGIQQYIYFKKLMTEWGMDLEHLEYWDFTQPIDVNMSAIGFHPNRNLIPFIVKKFKHLKHYLFGELWTTEYLSNVFPPDYVHEIIITQAKESHHQDERVRSVTLLSSIFNKYTENEYRSWFSGHVKPELLALWIMRYKTWFNYQTNVYVPEFGITIAVNHHEVITAASKKQSFWRKIELKVSTHPKNHFAFLVEIMAKSIATKLMKDRRVAIKFPPSPFESTSLPNTWRHIGTDHDLISEGQIMHHCCGGMRYIKSVNKSKSLFYHIDTDEQYGLTAEFKPYDLALIRPMTTLDQWIPQINNAYYNAKMDKVNVWALHQVEGRFSRKPKAQELFNLNLAITKACDLSKLYTLIGVDRVGVLTNNGDTVILSVDDPDFKTKYITAINAGAVKYVYLTVGKSIPVLNPEKTDLRGSRNTRDDDPVETTPSFSDLLRLVREKSVRREFRNQWSSKSIINNGWGLTP